MRFRHHLLIMLFITIASSPHARADDPVGVGDAPLLFLPAAAPAFPGNASHAGTAFFRIDAAAFDGFDPEPGAPFMLAGIPLPHGGRASARVERIAVLGGDGAVHVNGILSDPAPRHILLTGSVSGAPGSHIYLALFRDRVFGYIDPGDERRTRIILGPTGADTDICGVIDEADMPERRVRPACLAEELDQYRDAAAHQDPPPQARSGGTRTASTASRLNLAVDCDYAFHQMNGYSTTNSTAYATALVGAITDIYRRDANIVFWVTYLNVWTSTGPYTASSTSNLLTQMANYWNANRGSVTRATAVLLSGKSAGGGIAYLNVLCQNSSAYAVAADLVGGYTWPPSGFIWDIDCPAHELGHNVGARHTHNCWWAPAIDSCVAAEGGTCFSTPVATLGTIMSYCHLTPESVALNFGSRVSAYLTTRATAATCRISQSVPDVDAGPDRGLCGAGAVQIGNAATSGTPPYTYLWWPAPGLSGTTVARPYASPAVETKYFVRATDANGYRAYDSVIVAPGTIPTAEAGPDWIYCAGRGVTIGGAPTGDGGTPPYTYQWTPATGLGSATSPNPTAAPPQTTVYRVVVTDALGCQSADSMTVAVGSGVVADAGPDQIICPGGQVQIGGTASGGMAPYTYQWAPSTSVNDPTSPTPLATPGATMILALTVTDANGCTDVDSVLVTVSNTLAAHAGPDRAICRGSAASIGLPASGGLAPYSYSWTPATGLNDAMIMTPDASPQSTTVYIVEATDGLGCVSADTVVVTVRIPSAVNLTWTGAKGTDWNTTGNWSDTCAVPVDGSSITIPPSTVPPENNPVLALADLTLNNAAGLTLANNLTVNGTLTMTAGRISLGDHRLTIGPAGQILSGNAAKYIVTNGDGALTIAGIGATGRMGGVLFPIGPTPTSYNPVTIINSGVIDAFSARVTPTLLSNATFGPTLTSHVVERTWFIEEGTPGGSTVTLTLQWENAHATANFVRDAAYVAHHNGVEWLALTTAGRPLGGGPYILAATGVTAFPPLAIGDSASSLPVELLSLTAGIEGKAIRLTWATSSEQHCLGFGIERRQAAHGDWTVIGFEAARGGDTEGRYTFVDERPPTPALEYRLRIVDLDGSVSSSPVVTVEATAPPVATLHEVHPNPASGSAAIRFTLPRDMHARIEIVDLLGRRVLTVTDGPTNAGTHVLPLHIASLPSGSYRCVLHTDDAGQAVMLVIR